MGGKLCDWKVEEIEMLLEEGLSHLGVSRLTGVSSQTVMRYHRKMKGENAGRVLTIEEKNEYARKKGYLNHAHYSKVNESLRKETGPYQKVSLIVKRRLDYLIDNGFYKSRRDFAIRNDFPRRYLSAIENGKNFPRNSYLEGLCNALEIKESKISRWLNLKE